MGRKSSGHRSNCPHCGVSSSSVSQYRERKLSHYSIGGMEKKIIPTLLFRCQNSLCLHKTFTHHIAVEGIEELDGRSRYTKSSKAYVVNKMLRHQVSYNSFCKGVKEDFGGCTSLSTVHTWVKQAKVSDVELEIEAVKVLHTDEKHPSKKKGNGTQNLL
jgi:hypothetical protein